ncbi:MAG: class IV adenylate cyclase [Desulfobacterales bacterium]
MDDPEQTQTPPLEIEVKFYVQDAEVLKRQFVAAGAVGRGRVFETNHCFDDDNARLTKSAALLRLRQDDRARLTLKTPPQCSDPRFKTYREDEVVVSDFDTMTRILEGLGFRRRQVYEKWRETFAMEDALLCIDTLPFGNFIEIEGAGEAIIRLAARLGFDWEQRILTNYLAIFDRIKRRFNLPFDDVTFRNFESVSIDIEPLLRQMVAA